MELQIKTQHTDKNFLVMKIIGEMDVYTSPKLRSEISRQIKSGNHRILLDLSELEYLDSTGLGVLAESLSELQKCGGDLRLLSPASAFLRLLNLTNLSNSFIIYQSFRDAQNSWHSAS